MGADEYTPDIELTPEQEEELSNGKGEPDDQERAD